MQTLYYLTILLMNVIGVKSLTIQITNTATKNLQINICLLYANIYQKKNSYY